MCWNYWLKVIVLMVCCVGIEAADDIKDILQRLDATDAVVKALYHRVDALESREKIHLDKIAELESYDKYQQETIEKLQQELQKRRYHTDYLNGILEYTENNESLSHHTIQSQEGATENRHTLLAPKGKSKQRIRQPNVQSPIGFFAVLEKNFMHAGALQPIVFDTVKTNIGSAYNQNDGVFTAPIEGIYVFSTTLMSYLYTPTHVSFYRNADALNLMYLNGDQDVEGSTSATITVHLQTGDIVTVRNIDSDKSILGREYSSFTGFLLSNLTSIVAK